MGILADTFKVQLDELKRRDEESQRETDRLLASLRDIARRLEALQFDDA